LRPGAPVLTPLLAGIGHVAFGMPRQGHAFQPTRDDNRGWRGTFNLIGMKHSPTSDGPRGSTRRGARH